MNDGVNNAFNTNNLFNFSDFFKQSEDTLSAKEDASDKDLFSQFIGEYSADTEEGYYPQSQESIDNSSGKYGNKFTDIFLYRIMRPFSTAQLFLDNQEKLENSRDSKKDKYYHARANAQAGQYFDISTAVSISLGREIWDVLRKNTWDYDPNVQIQDILNDSWNDLRADMYGLKQGLLHPLSDVDSILDEEWLRHLNK